MNIPVARFDEDELKSLMVMDTALTIATTKWKLIEDIDIYDSIVKKYVLSYNDFQNEPESWYFIHYLMDHPVNHGGNFVRFH